MATDQDEKQALVQSSNKEAPEKSTIESLAEVVESFSGPIPHPDTLNKYNPATADRIVTMAEKEQDHRHEIEKTGINAAISAEKRGQTYALLICLVSMIGTIMLIWNGYGGFGILLTGGTLTGLVYIFITGRPKKKNEEMETPQQSG